MIPDCSCCGGDIILWLIIRTSFSVSLRRVDKTLNRIMKRPEARRKFMERHLALRRVLVGILQDLIHCRFFRRP